MAKLIIEGQAHVVADALVMNGATAAEQDQNLRDALRPNFDLAANATFRREEKDGELTVTVIKSPGTKGGVHPGYTRLVRCITAAPHEMSESMILACKLHLLQARGELTLEALIALQAPIEHALKKGEKAQAALAHARQVLLNAPALASPVVPPGF